SEVTRDLADDPQLLGSECATVDADAEHEVPVLELVRLERGGLAAVDALLALGVQAPPAETTVQVLRRDRVKALLGVDLLDACPHVERVVFELKLLVGVQGLELTEGPLTLATLGPGRAPGIESHNAKFGISKHLLMNRVRIRTRFLTPV